MIRAISTPNAEAKQKEEGEQKAGDKEALARGPSPTTPAPPDPASPANSAKPAAVAGSGGGEANASNAANAQTGERRGWDKEKKRDKQKKRDKPKGWSPTQARHKT